ncbi:MAG: Cof-type HAD-IIB family hydrolase [Actinomycetia bacterium]|nr:Cof-type HAD-IIB family hydrolase [Actinomycetes bacterium]
MSFTPRLLALDVDGTLVNNANEMSAGVREAVRAAADAGLHVVISTGRSLPGVMDAARKLDIGDSLAVASNGAVVFGHDPIEILHTVTFDSREAVKLLLEHVPDAAVAVEEIGIGYRINKPFPDGEINGRMTVQTIDELVADPVTRVIIRSPESSAEEFAEMAHSLGLVGTNYFVGYTAWLDLAPDGVSKASGLQVVTDRLGLSAADVLAIGDGDNDVEMLKWAGRGVAMGQAPIAVQDVADTVTETVDNDGVALEISKYL